jgi:hypothetical protein
MMPMAMTPIRNWIIRMAGSDENLDCVPEGVVINRSTGSLV